MLAWLTTLGLEQYASLFLENEVDFATVQVLTDGDLKELGLPFGPRKRILRAVADLKTANDAPAHVARPTPDGIAAVSDGERRQLTVLFCDMVGFTELASRVDPEILQGVIRRYEDICAVCITRYEGYVFQRLGDGIVAFFGFPLAHEGEAERAVRAGLEIIESLARTVITEVGHLQVRVGIATGVVVVSAAERSAVGETMNLAARLQSIAQPGTIVVSEKVHRLAAGAFRYDDLGEKQLKGIAARPRAYAVLGISGIASRFEAATHGGVSPLVGRELEIGTLLDRWQEARDGHGRLVMLNGEAGIGKSRMLSALREHLESMGADTARFQCSPFHVNSALHPSIDALERALNFSRDESTDSRLDKLESLVTGHFGRPREDVPFIADVLSIPTQERYGRVALSARRRKEESMRALVDLTIAAAHARPTLMLFEDAHWADPSSLELLALLIARLDEHPLLVVLTHRPEFHSQWLGLEHVSSMDLNRLKRDESQAIVARLANGKSLPSQLIDDIVHKADGVPLFLEEVTKSVLESGDLTELADRYVYAGSGADMVLPATLRDSLMARLDRVSSVKDVAQIGAVIGREFSYELLAAVAPMLSDTLEQGLDRLTEAGLAFRRGRIPDATYTFKHALIQDVAYDSLLRSRRLELHGAIARALAERSPDVVEHAPELLARHYTAAALDEEAIPYWRRAGELALRRTALPEAIAHLRAGLSCIERLAPSDERDVLELRLRTLLGPAVLAHQGWASPEVGAALEPAWRLAEELDSRESVLPVTYGLWVHNMSAGRLSESMRWAERMLTFAAGTHDENFELCGHRAALASRFWQGDFNRAREHGDAVRRLYVPERHAHIATLTTSDPLAGDGIYRAHYLWMLGYPDQARQIARETAAYVRQLNHPFEIAFALTLGAQVYEYCHEPESLLQSALEAERVGKEFGVPLMSEIMAEISKGEAWLLEGRIADSIGQLRESIRRLNNTGHRVWVAYLGVRLGEAMALDGDLDGGLALMNESLAREECREDRAHLAEMLRLKGWLLAKCGIDAAAEDSLRAAISVAQEQQAKSWELRASTTLARLLATRGDRSAAHALLAPVYDFFTEGFDSRDLQDARQLLADLARA